MLAGTSCICPKDSLYNAISIEMSHLTPAQMSQAINTKLKSYNLVSHKASSKPAGEAEPLLLTSATMAKLVDTSLVASVRCDVRRQPKDTTDPTSVFNHRCTLCGISLNHAEVYSCTAPLRTSDDAPCGRFHHYCRDCNGALQRGVLYEDDCPRCVRCNRIIPRERNLSIEAQIARTEQ